MKVPLIWLKDYLTTDKSPRQIAESFTQLGLMLDKPIENNVLDLEHRMDRSDWLSITGCARDLAAFDNIPLSMPKVPYHKPVKTNKVIPVTIQTPAVKRFQTRVFHGIKVAPSPSWLVERLTAYGIKPINNIVDITNFVMVELGQPMHAQDLAKLASSEITLRPAKNGEQLTTLLGTDVLLDPNTFVLSSGGQVTVIGGIVGGAHTGVTKETTDIILDAGNYDSKVVRSTSRRLKIINETVSRYDKFLDPRAIDLALDRATDLILSLAGGTYSTNSDYYPSPILPHTLTLTLSRLKLISGLAITLPEAKKILRSLGYAIIEESSITLTVEIPYFRTDVEVEDDLIADVLRIYNYANIPTLPLSSPVPADITPSVLAFEDHLRDLLLSYGLHEHINNSLTTFNNESGQIKLVNSISMDQNSLRTSLLPGLLHVQSTYVKHKITPKGLFEIGLVFSQKKASYHELRHLSVVAKDAKNILATLLHNLGINNYLLTNDGQVSYSGQTLGSYTTTSFTLLTDQIHKYHLKINSIISEFAHPITLDLSLIAPTTVSYADILDVTTKLDSHWESLTCKDVSLVNNLHNYLLTLSWPENSPFVESDKKLFLTSLQTKLKITSKS